MDLRKVKDYIAMHRKKRMDSLKALSNRRYRSAMEAQAPKKLTKRCPDGSIVAVGQQCPMARPKMSTTTRPKERVKPNRKKKMGWQNK